MGDYGLKEAIEDGLIPHVQELIFIITKFKYISKM